MNRILVIRGGAIGDFVLTLPAISLLRGGFPKARIEILGYKHIAALAEGRFYAEATRSIEYSALAGFFGNGTDLLPGLCDYFHSFDLVVSYLFDPDGHFHHNLQRCGVEEVLACSPRICGGEHAARQLARPLEELGLSLRDPAATLYPSASDQKFAAHFCQRIGRPIVALHPGSGSKSKNWPISKWTELAEAILVGGRAASLLFIGGEADQEKMNALRLMSGDAVHLAENLPLPILAAILEQCAVFVGHDSGISHIAAAIGTPSVLLFGPTDPDVWAPANRDVRVLRAPNGDLAHLPLSAVTEAVDQELMRIGIRT